MPVEIVAKGPLCKFCRSDKADRINNLLERWHHREDSDEGGVITRSYVLKRLAEWGIDNPNYDNIKSHRKHIRIVSEAQAASVAQSEEEDNADWVEAQKRILEKIAERGGDVADRVVETQLLIFEEFTRIQLEKGIAKPATLDQIRGMIGEKTKRKASDAQDELLKALGGGIGMVFEKALGGGDQPKQIERVIDGEVVECDPGICGGDCPECQPQEAAA